MKSHNSNIVLSLVAVFVTIGFLYLAVQLIKNPNEDSISLYSQGNWNSDFEFSQSIGVASSDNSSLMKVSQKFVKSSQNSDKGAFILNKSASGNAVSKLDLNNDELIFNQYMSTDNGQAQFSVNRGKRRTNSAVTNQNIAMSDFKLNLLDISKKRVERSSGTSVLAKSDVLGNSEGPIKVAPPTEEDPGTTSVPVGNGLLIILILASFYAGIKLRKSYSI